jgi:hypothetical protein
VSGWFIHPNSCVLRLFELFVIGTDTQNHSKLLLLITTCSYSYVSSPFLLIVVPYGILKDTGVWSAFLICERMWECCFSVQWYTFEMLTIFFVHTRKSLHSTCSLYYTEVVSCKKFLKLTSASDETVDSNFMMLCSVFIWHISFNNTANYTAACHLYLKKAYILPLETLLSAYKKSPLVTTRKRDFFSLKF